MKKIFYEKKGRKYVPVSEYDNELLDAFPKGNHLVSVYPGGSSRKFNIDPNYAALIAAGRVAEEAISKAIHDASELRRRNGERNPLSKEQFNAWNKFIDMMGEDARMLEWASTRELAEVGVKAMIEEAEKLMTVPAVKKAFEHFLLVCELTKEEKHELSR